jgi:hypothetical protein
MTQILLLAFRRKLVVVTFESKCIHLNYYIIFIIKGASFGKEHLMSALAKINDKLNVIENQLSQ